MNASKRLNGLSYLSFRKELEDRGIVFSYSGYLNEDILSGIGNALRSKMTIDRTEEKISRAVFSAFVEQVQNVIRYSAETSTQASSGEVAGTNFKLVSMAHPALRLSTSGGV